jgi:hypothetical protein
LPSSSAAQLIDAAIKGTLLARFAHNRKCFVFYLVSMSDDWRLDRLTERVDRIEQERWDERQHALERNARILLTIVWMTNAAIIALTIAKGAS